MKVYHGGLGEITEFCHSYGGDNTCDNEHGAFYFSESYEVAEDYSRQAFIRRYQDDVDSLKDDFGVEVPEDEDQYSFVEELAEDHLNVCEAELLFENPFVIDAGYRNLREFEKEFHIQNAIGFLMGIPVDEIPEEFYDDFDEENPFDGLIIENVIDDIGERSCVFSNIHIAIRPDQVRILNHI